MSWNSGANENLVQTRLDSYVKEEFDRRSPDEVMVDDALFFNQQNFDKGVYVHEELEGVGPFYDTAEEQIVNETSPRSDNLVSTRIRKYALDLPIPDEAFKDAQLGSIQRVIADLSRQQRVSRDSYGYQRTYGDAFSGVTTPDGAAACSNSHTSLSGDTVDNLETGSLTATNLEVVVRSLRRQRAQSGQLGGHVVAGLLVALSLHEDAFEITKSELAPYTGDNQVNYWSKVYPGMRVGTSAFLHTDYNGGLNSNVNTSYFVVSKNHHVTRLIREGYNSEIVEPKYDKKDRWYYKARFREVTLIESWGGLVGSSGTT